jgi:hypothetical protein
MPRALLTPDQCWVARVCNIDGRGEAHLQNGRMGGVVPQ